MRPKHRMKEGGKAQEMVEQDGAGKKNTGMDRNILKGTAGQERTELCGERTGQDRRGQKIISRNTKKDITREDRTGQEEKGI